MMALPSFGFAVLLSADPSHQIKQHLDPGIALPRWYQRCPTESHTAAAVRRGKVEILAAPRLLPPFALHALGYATDLPILSATTLVRRSYAARRGQILVLNAVYFACLMIYHKGGLNVLTPEGKWAMPRPAAALAACAALR